jgi:epoxyqueuosine reductase
VELREQIGDWFFGCDLCQTVCPWNQKAFKGVLSVERVQTLNEDEESQLAADLKYILNTSGKKLSKDFAGTPLARAGSFGLKKNALVVIANRKIAALKPEVAELRTHEKLGELAQWTLGRLEAPVNQRTTV